MRLPVRIVEPKSDTFHEVKTKRYKKRENMNSREIVDTRWRFGPPGRFGR